MKYVKNENLLPVTLKQLRQLGRLLEDIDRMDGTEKLMAAAAEEVQRLYSGILYLYGKKLIEQQKEPYIHDLKAEIEKARKI